MSLTEARDQLVEMIDAKLVKRIKKGGGNQPRIQVDEFYRGVMLWDQFDIANYSIWLAQRNIRVSLAEQDPRQFDQDIKIQEDKSRSSDKEPERLKTVQIYIKVLEQPTVKELPRPLLRSLRRKLRSTYSSEASQESDWQGVNLGAGGKLIIIYDAPDDLPPGRKMRRTHSLYLPANKNEEAVFTEYLSQPVGFKQRLKRWNPLNRIWDKDGISEGASELDVKAVAKMVEICSFYDWPKKYFLRREVKALED